MKDSLFQVCRDNSPSTRHLDVEDDMSESTRRSVVGRGRTIGTLSR